LTLLKSAGRDKKRGNGANYSKGILLFYSNATNFLGERSTSLFSTSGV
jgi:hypothetical protein